MKSRARRQYPILQVQSALNAKISTFIPQEIQLEVEVEHLCVLDAAMALVRKMLTYTHQIEVFQSFKVPNWKLSSLCSPPDRQESYTSLCFLIFANYVMTPFSKRAVKIMYPQMTILSNYMFLGSDIAICSVGYSLVRKIVSMIKKLVSFDRLKVVMLV